MNSQLQKHLRNFLEFSQQRKFTHQDVIRFHEWLYQSGSAKRIQPNQPVLSLCRTDRTPQHCSQSLGAVEYF